MTLRAGGGSGILPGVQARTPVRVLVVDDEDMFSAALVALLGTDSRVRVVATAASGSEALAAAAVHHPDVVLMDIGLPDMDGLEVTRRLRDSARELRVIVVSGWEADAYDAAAREAGASAVLTKGGIDSALIDTITTITADGATLA